MNEALTTLLEDKYTPAELVELLPNLPMCDLISLLEDYILAEFVEGGTLEDEWRTLGYGE